jgi:hypothetical protein
MDNPTINMDNILTLGSPRIFYLFNLLLKTCKIINSRTFPRAKDDCLTPNIRQDFRNNHLINAFYIAAIGLIRMPLVIRGSDRQVA